MRRLACLTILTFFATATPGQEAAQGDYAPVPEYRTFGVPGSEVDAKAISALMSGFSSAWARQDVDAVVDTYAEDAEWVNAFGMVSRGHAELRKTFTRLFQRFPPPASANDSKAAPAKPEDPPPGFISLRYIGSDAAVIHTLTESRWGQNRDGSAVRRVLVTFVLGKRTSGWKIVHQMIMDVRR